MHISSHASVGKHQIKRMFMGHCRSAGPQNQTCIISPSTYDLVATLEFWKIYGPQYMHIRISMYLVQSCYWFVKMLWYEHLFVFRQCVQPACPIS